MTWPPSERQLERLEKQAAAALEQNPDLKGRLKRSDVGGTSYLTLTLDGSLIPWDEVPLDDFRQIEADQGDVRQDRGAAEGDDAHRGGRRPAGELPAGVDRLVDGRFDAVRARQAPCPAAGIGPLQMFAGKRFISVGYMSEARCARIATNKRRYRPTAENGRFPVAAGQIARRGAGANSQGRRRPGRRPQNGDPRRRRHDGPELPHRSRHRELPVFLGPATVVGRLAAAGPLQHVGGNPTVAAVNRGKVSVANYDLLVKWLGVGYH